MKKGLCIYLLAVFAVLGAILYTHQSTSYSDEVDVTGAVVDVRPSSEVIEFHLKGSVHRFSRTISKKQLPAIGSKRLLAVDPADPQKVRVKKGRLFEVLFPRTLKESPLTLFFWLAGCVLCAVGVFWYISYCEFFSRAIIVQGRVTSYKTRHTRKGGVSYIEIVSFNFEGQTRTLFGFFGQPFKPVIGTVREVGIDPNNPQKARLRSGSWIGPVFMLIGLAAWAAAILIC